LDVVSTRASAQSPNWLTR